jgi:hypothetical protein
MNEPKTFKTDMKQETINEKTDKKYFLTEESFEILKKAQERIKEQTDCTPTLRKLINRLITQTKIDELTQEMINEYRD